MLSKLTKQTVEDLAKQGMRVDGRGLLDRRPFTIKTGVIKSAEGSAWVTLGNTVVLVGVKMKPSEPYPDTPNEGVLVTTAEMAPIASPTFESGPPSPESIELARVVDRVIRESKMIDVTKLAVPDSEGLVWMINLDFYTLDMDGNLFDAAALGAVAALKTAKIPGYDPETGKVLYDERKDPLPVVDTPVSCTFAKLGDKIALDPTEMEEDVMSARLTIGITSKGEICAMQKGGRGYFTMDELKWMAEEAVKQAEKTRKELP